ncbi:MAG: hypothetical protein DYG98_02170 [Haliscomenobacteraceae bacterium CHB4]|nr:hypothetical protein [Haliscomenobacteraceae bacterium CHB4]
MNSPIEAIKQAVAENRTSDALSRLLELTQSNKQLHDAIHIVLAEFNDLTSQRLKGMIDNSEATRRLNVIHDKILVAPGAFDSQGRVLPGSVTGKKTSAAGMLGKITIYLWGGAVDFTIIVMIFDIVTHFTMGEGKAGELYELTIVPAFLGFVTFIGYVLAMVVSASKK